MLALAHTLFAPSMALTLVILGFQFLAAEKRLGLQADRMRAAATSEDHDQDQEDHDTKEPNLPGVPVNGAAPGKPGKLVYSR